MQDNLLTYAIDQVKWSLSSCCKFISANDIGKKKGEGTDRQSHQCGYYISNEAGRRMFGCQCIKGDNEDKLITIRWNDDIETSSRFIYYGRGTRNESRITNFGRGFEFLQEEYLGSLLILCKQNDEYFTAIILTADEDIESFLEHFNLPLKRFNLIEKDSLLSPDEMLQGYFNSILHTYSSFPDTTIMSQLARCGYNDAYGIQEKAIVANPDKILMNWLSTESSLFYQFEEMLYRPIYSKPFNSCQELVQISNEILNRRKSRAGKSLEHHLASVFTSAELQFEEQVITENNKKPDFIFPGSEAYHNLLFPAEELVFLGAKTTCKDRWRQVLNEADRIDIKYLFTLQPGISTNQLKEMKSENLLLVVPKENRDAFDPNYRNRILSLKEFVDMVKVKQEHLPQTFLL